MGTSKQVAQEDWENVFGPAGREVVNLLGEGEIVAVAAAPGEGASAAEVAVAAGGSAHTADLHEAESQFGTERPAPLPSPFTVLFVGANVSDQAELKLKEEFDRLRRALEHEKGKEWWEGRVKLSTTASRMPPASCRKLRRENRPFCTLLATGILREFTWQAKRRMLVASEVQGASSRARH